MRWISGRTELTVCALLLVVLGVCCRLSPAEATPTPPKPGIPPAETATGPAVMPETQAVVFQAHVTRTPRPTASVTPSGSSWTCSPGTQDVFIFSAGEERRFRIHVPEQVNEGQAAALVVSIHGHNASAELQETWSEFSPLADKEGFIVVYPQALHHPAAWDNEPSENNLDIPFFQTMLDNIEAHCTIDKRRIFVTGASNGGGMTNRIGCEFSRQVAAIAPVVGAYSYFMDCDIKRPLPVVAFHGTADEIVLYDGARDGFVLEKDTSAWPSIPYWAATWALRDGCAARPQAVNLAGGVLRETWGDCKEGAEVVLYTVEGGGHVWFGSGSTPVTGKGFHASRIIWEFFEKHPLPE